MDQSIPAAPAAAPSFTPEQSPHWDERQGGGDFFDAEFPLQEGMPKYGAENGARYELILRGGDRVQAHVDYSRQYMAEGREWVADGEITFPSRYIVAAWKRIA